MGFDAFIGNHKHIDRIRTKLRQNRFPHGLIFSGPDGIGKRTCASMLAKALNCVQSEPGDFCGVCDQCHKIDAGTHPDVSVIGIEEEASEIKIEQIREAIRLLGFQPLEGRNKVFIIDPADLLNASSANAMLKALEEPPENSYLILVTRKLQAILPTVRSRCQSYAFSPLSLNELRRFDPSCDELILRWCRGSIGLLKSLDASTLIPQREVILNFIETAVLATEQQFRDLLAAAKEVAGTKQEFGLHLEMIGVIFEDLLYIREGFSDRIVNVDIRPRLEKLSEKTSTELWIRLAEFLQMMESSMKTHVNRPMLTDVLALHANLTVEKILDDNPLRSR